MSSNTLKALEYGVGLIGIPYGYWEGGENQIMSPMFAQNGGIINKKEIRTALDESCSALVSFNAFGRILSEHQSLTGPILGTRL